MRAHLTEAAVLLAALALPAPGHSQSAAGQVKYTKIVDLDSTDVAHASLSPNGKWILYDGGTMYSRTHNLWLVSSTGGKPSRITSGDFNDFGASWFPGSDRIVFTSARVDGALMTVGVDPATGRVTDPPKRLTLEPAAGGNVSPDGRLVVYRTNNMLQISSHVGALRIIPATGGTARTLDSAVTAGDGFATPRFTSDGRFVEYIAAHVKTPAQGMRVSVSGGNPAVARDGTQGMISNGHASEFIMVAGDGLYSHYRVGVDDTVRLENAGGETLHLLALRGMRRAQFQSTRITRGTNSMVLVTKEEQYEVHVAPAAGGAVRAVRKGSVDEYLVGFLGDDRVALENRVNGRAVVDIMPAGGGTPQRIVLPDSAHPDYITNDGKLIYWRTNRQTHGVYDVATGTSQTISHNVISGASGNVSLLSSRDDAFYVDAVGDTRELRAWSPLTKTSRLVRSMPAHSAIGDFVTHGATGDFVTHGDLVSFSATDGDSVTVYLANGASAPAQRVFTTRGKHSDGISISRDGRRLAFGIQRISDHDTTHAIGIADIRADGTAGTPRLVPTENLSGLEWQPNGKDIVFLVLHQDGNGSMMRLAANEGARPEPLAANDHHPVWDFSVSADGKWVAYPAELPSHAALWRVDLPNPRK